MLNGIMRWLTSIACVLTVCMLVDPSILSKKIINHVIDWSMYCLLLIRQALTASVSYKSFACRILSIFNVGNVNIFIHLLLTFFFWMSPGMPQRCSIAIVSCYVIQGPNNRLQTQLKSRCAIDRSRWTLADLPIARYSRNWRIKWFALSIKVVNYYVTIDEWRMIVSRALKVRLKPKQNLTNFWGQIKQALTSLFAVSWRCLCWN